MTLPKTIIDLEKGKFAEDSQGNTAVRTVSEIDGTIEASYSPSGLFKEGRISTVTVGTTWTALPVIPLTDRNAMSIQNNSDVDIKINYDPLVSGYNGLLVKSKYERYYDIKDTIIVYAKTETGSAQIVVEELA